MYIGVNGSHIADVKLDFSVLFYISIILTAHMFVSSLFCAIYLI